MRKTVALFDVDSKIPNLALMKLSTYYKQQGYAVILYKHIVKCNADILYASAIFNSPKSLERVQWLKYLYGNTIEIGGSGVDLKKRLSPEIEKCFPDYDLYNHDKYAIGFLTRGCDNRCRFCLVPEKEGPKRVVATFADFMPKNQQNLLLLDDNLLSFQEAKGLLKEMAQQKYAVNFSQSLDISYLNEETFNLLMQVDSRNSKFTKRMYYFSCNSLASVNKFYERKDLLKGFGREAVSVIMMYGFNTRLSEEYEMFLMYKRIGLIPFVQEYHPIAGVSARIPEDYFDFDLDKVIALTCRTNGQNGEKYLKWLNNHYFNTYGKYYLPLIEKIYRYNNKNAINRYLKKPELLTNELYKIDKEKERAITMTEYVRSFSGRNFTSKDMEQIKWARQTYPELSRAGLSKVICRIIDWVNEAGKEKINPCKTFLERLEKEGELDLPPIETQKRTQKKEKKAVTIKINDEIIDCKYSQLPPIRLEIVSPGANLKRWRTYVDNYHMLGDKQAFGARLHYFIMSGDREIGCLQFSASAWALMEREEWIGWNLEDRKQRLNLIVNNSRFLIFPWVKVKYLASAVLAMAAKRIPVDWLKRYNYAPVLLETFVDLDHFKGTCYKAANWVLLGETKGRGRMDTKKLYALSQKAIFMYPLQKNFRECLKGLVTYKTKPLVKQPKILKRQHTDVKLADYNKKNNSLRKNGRMRFSKISDSEIVALREQGLTLNEIIIESKLCLNTIRNILKDHRTFAYSKDEAQFKDGLISFERKIDIRGLVCEGKFIRNLNCYISDFIDNKDTTYTIVTKHNSYIKKYLVQIIDGCMADSGTITYADGSSYEGQIKDGYPHGIGVRTGINYQDEGQFIDGFISYGTRTSSWRDGYSDVYEGEFAKNICNGKGKMKFSDGEIHEGHWLDDQRSGPGKVIYPNGEIIDIDY